jgi:hypothetical protein
MRSTESALVAIVAALMAVALSVRSLAPGPAKAVTSQQNKDRPVQQELRTGARGQPPPAMPGAADHPPVDEAPTPLPQAWSDAEVAGALEECNRLLTPLDAVFDVSKPIRTGQCGTPAPVLVRRIAGVEITPPTIMNCRVAAKLHEWIGNQLQPIAAETLGDPITRIVSASGYSCRQRIGNSSGKQSEHSFANAFDISAVITRDGRTIDVLTGWGPTVRDQRAQAQAAGGQAGNGGDPQPLSDAQRDPTARLMFLHKLHASACGVFSTVLGPEANEAHRNHLHLDLAQRRSSAFCE